MTFNPRELLTHEQQAVLEQVEGRRRDNPVTGTQIANTIGLRLRSNGKPGADLRAIVNAVRKKGFPICSSGEGYYWPASRDELTEYIDSFKRRVADQQKAIDGLEHGYDKITFSVKAKIEADSRAGVYVIRRKYPEEDSYVQVSAENVDAFLAANPTAVKYP